MIRYNASPTLKHFHRSNARVRGIRGPVGSGKSVACCWELWRRAHEQQPNERGLRRSRWVIVRNTYRELVDTTCKTFFDWFPQELGEWRSFDMEWRYRGKQDDGTTVDAEFLFRACDRPADVRKFKSLEVTGAWLNEAGELAKPTFDMVDTRIGRYPPKRDEGASWIGIILDTNPPDTDHWWYKCFEELRPDDWEQYTQPSGLSDEAENIHNLPDGYYQKMIAGKTREWVKVFVEGNYGFISDGKPVFPEFHDGIHSCEEGSRPPLYQPIFIGLDFGLTPAACFGWVSSTGRLVVCDELVCADMGAQNFAKALKHRIAADYQGHPLIIVGDPAGEQRAQTDETTPFMILNAEGINAIPASTNDFTIRRETVAAQMMRLDMAGDPAFAVGPKAITLRKALGGGYKYRRMQVSGSEIFRDVPDKDKFSHVADALQYMALEALGAGQVLGALSNKPLDFSYINRGIV